MSKFHVAVVGSRPLKNGNRNAEFPNANADFINEVLYRVSKQDYASVLHTATDYGVDATAESFAQVNNIKQYQFPAYWFDPTKEKNLNKSAGIASREAMIRKLKDLTYNKSDVYAMLLVFHTQESPTEDDGLKALLEFVTKYHPYVQVRCFRLPVHDVPKAQPEQGVIDLSASSGIPDPFAVPQ